MEFSFTAASNNTFCEGRVVWTERSEDGAKFQSGIDIQRWSGGIHGKDAIHDIPALKPKKDRRKRPR